VKQLLRYHLVVTEIPQTVLILLVKATVMAVFLFLVSNWNNFVLNHAIIVKFTIEKNESFHLYNFSYRMIGQRRIFV